MELKEFNKFVRKYAIDNGFSEIYKSNHPDDNHNRIDLIQSGIRICFVIILHCA